MEVSSCGKCELTMLQVFRMDKEAVLNFYFNHNIILKTKKCLRCNHEMNLSPNDLLFQCQRTISIGDKKGETCNYKSSARTGSFIHLSHLPIDTIMYMIAIIVHLKRGILEVITSEFCVSSSTVVPVYSLCREVFVHHMIEISGKIGGPGSTIQIMEGKFYKRKYDKKRIVRQWVIIGLQRSTRDTFLIPVDRRDSETLVAVLKQWILPGTRIISDLFKDYDCLSNEGFQYLLVNHSFTFIDPDTKAFINNVTMEWQASRRNIPRYAVQKSVIAGYLAEFQFKRKYPCLKDRLHIFFQAATKLYPPQP